MVDIFMIKRHYITSKEAVTFHDFAATLSKI